MQREDARGKLHILDAAGGVAAALLTLQLQHHHVQGAASAPGGAETRAGACSRTPLDKGYKK